MTCRIFAVLSPLSLALALGACVAYGGEYGVASPGYYGGGYYGGGYVTPRYVVPAPRHHHGGWGGGGHYRHHRPFRHQW